jgi:SMI1-KNR4 cell-wall
MEPKRLGDLDWSHFWEDDEYALQNFVEPYPKDSLIKSIEKKLGYKLPNSYIELMKLQNGGIPTRRCFPTQYRTSWAPDHVAIVGLLGIGRTKPYSLCGAKGSRFWIKAWGYPKIGVYIATCPSAGHDMIALDYSHCGTQGEPEVVHLDEERDYKKTFVAKDFETFLRGLVVWKED